MYYTVYKVTNKINGKFYIGTHKTKDLDDNYMGSGKYLKHSQLKHGKENFKKEILFVFDNPDDMFAKEAEIVNEDFIAEEDNYNLKVGGFGGWDYVNQNISDEKRKIISSLGGRTNHISLEDRGNLISYALCKKYANDDLRKKRYEGQQTFKGKSHTLESKKKIGEANSKHQNGEGNSQFGTMWIYNLELKVSKKIPKGEMIPEGWHKGRKIKF